MKANADDSNGIPWPIGYDWVKRRLHDLLVLCQSLTDLHGAHRPRLRLRQPATCGWRDIAISHQCGGGCRNTPRVIASGYLARIRKNAYLA